MAMVKQVQLVHMIQAHLLAILVAHHLEPQGMQAVAEVQVAQVQLVILEEQTVVKAETEKMFPPFLVNLQGLLILVLAVVVAQMLVLLEQRV
jgi:hypothetical protein